MTKIMAMLLVGGDEDNANESEIRDCNDLTLETEDVFFSDKRHFEFFMSSGYDFREGVA